MRTARLLTGCAGGSRARRLFQWALRRNRTRATSGGGRRRGGTAFPRRRAGFASANHCHRVYASNRHRVAAGRRRADRRDRFPDARHGRDVPDHPGESRLHRSQPHHPGRQPGLAGARHCYRRVPRHDQLASGQQPRRTYLVLQSDRDHRRAHRALQRRQLDPDHQRHCVQRAARRARFTAPGAWSSSTARPARPDSCRSIQARKSMRPAPTPTSRWSRRAWSRAGWSRPTDRSPTSPPKRST